MMQTATLKEYETYDIKDKNWDLAKFHCYLKKCGIEKVFDFYPDYIKAKNYVGVIKFKNLQFQILPKLISEGNDEGQIIKNLLFMLSYTKNLNIKTLDCVKLSKCKNLFLEILIREFANSLFCGLKRTIPKNYIREEENLNFLKGKIKFSENVKYNCANLAKFYCEYDSFSENNELNQLFLFVSNILYNLSNDNKNKKTLKFIINCYSDISLNIFTQARAEKIKLSKNQQIFTKPFNLAKMFIEKLSVDLSKNKIDNISLIWDMNKLFEEFVFEFLKREFKNDKIEIKSQKGKKLLKNDKRKKRNTFVDIFIKGADENIVIDTKYKEFKTMNDIENADIYQVSTYCLMHKSNNALLLYPEYSEAKEENFYLNTDCGDYNIKFATINLKLDDLENNKSEIKERFEEIIPILKKCEND